MIEEARTLALRRGPWKYIQGKGEESEELYNLDSDVGEQTNVAAENSGIVADMKSQLQKLIDAKVGVRQHGAQ